MPLGPARRRPQRLDDAPHSVEHGLHVAPRDTWFPYNRCTLRTWPVARRSIAPSRRLRLDALTLSCTDAVASRASSRRSLVALTTRRRRAPPPRRRISTPGDVDRGRPPARGGRRSRRGGSALRGAPGLHRRSRGVLRVDALDASPASAAALGLQSVLLPRSGRTLRRSRKLREQLRRAAPRASRCASSTPRSRAGRPPPAATPRRSRISTGAIVVAVGRPAAPACRRRRALHVVARARGRRAVFFGFERSPSPAPLLALDCVGAAAQWRALRRAVSCAALRRSRA